MREPLNGNGRLLARLDERDHEIMRRLERIERMLESEVVHRQEFAPVQRAVYGLVGLTLSGVAGAVLALVLR